MGRTFIPDSFRKKYDALLGEESKAFFDYCTIKQPKSIWANSLMLKPELLEKQLVKKGWQLKRLAFHENAFALEGVERPGQSEEFRRGEFNVQEKAAMLPAVVLAPEKRELVLDAAAAPGNKTLQLACLMRGTGRIVAVDRSAERCKSLRFNAKKFTMKNVIVKQMDLLEAKRKSVFDSALLDAPCSSEGLVRKDFDALKNWSQELVERKAELQKKMLAKTLELVKPQGIILYSTCSLSPEENEEVVQEVLEGGKAELEEIKITGFKLRKGLLEYSGKKFDASMEKCMRVLPQDNDSQCFFMAKLRKTST